jgi:hypothetical protein
MALFKIVCIILVVAVSAHPNFCSVDYDTPDGLVAVRIIPNNQKTCIETTGETVSLYARDVEGGTNECGNATAGTAKPFAFPCNTKNDTCGQCCCDGNGTCVCAQHYSSVCIDKLYQLEFNSTDSSELESISDIKIGLIAFGSLVGVVVVILMIIYCGL